jgi:hypothetical protein|tara:strand:+ start:819 stop:1193 length:375 start_codon:yes stop_codon:yes gene_type:complete
MKKLEIKVTNIMAWEDFDKDSQQATDLFKECVKLMLLGCGNKTAVYSDQSDSAEDILQYNNDTLDFIISVVDGDSEDYESVRAGLEITLNDTLGEEFGVRFEIADLSSGNYQVVMEETENTVYA